jgi:hypothetical protein
MGSKYVPDVLTIVGAATLVGGVAMIYPPAAMIVAGVLMLVCARQLERPAP